MKMTLPALLVSAILLPIAPVMAQEAAKPVTLDTPAAPAAAKAPAKDYVIIKFGDQQLRLSEVLETWSTLFPGGSAPDFASFDENIRQNVLRGLVSEKLIYQEALKAGYDKNPEVKKRLADVERQLIMQSFIESKGASLITDAELKAAYDEKIKKSAGQEEVKARHILVKTEAEAKAIAEELKKGGNFEKIARDKSADKGSGAQGGDLGWFTKDKMIPEFAEAAFALKKGEVSAPVKSGFGWHIIKLEDRRQMAPASFAESKEELRAELSEKAIETYISGLLKTASVKYYDASGKELPFDAEAKAPAAGAETPKP